MTSLSFPAGAWTQGAEGRGALHLGRAGGPPVPAAILQGLAEAPGNRAAARPPFQ